MQLRSQQLSKAVYNQINQLSSNWANDEDHKKKKQYGSLCHKFPIMILHCGLSQTVGFLRAKSNGENSPHNMLLKHLAAINGETQFETANDFQQRVNSVNLQEYQRLTRNILSAAIWYKRFAESLLNVKQGEDYGD